MLTRMLLLTVLATALCAEDSYDDLVHKTDMGNADQVLSLAQWCTDHDKPTQARKYYYRVIHLDPDNETARAAIGEVKVGNHWVPQSQAKVVAGPDVGRSPPLSGAPTAAQITWDLHVPKDPQPENEFVDTYINKLPSIPNDSTEMDSAVATMLTDENLPMALPRLCKALARPDYNDLFGAANIVMGLVKAGRMEVAKPLLGFLVKGTEHCSDPEDIAAAAFAIGLFKDKRALPRLIELYDTKNDQVKEAVSNAVATITAMPPPVSKAKAQEWWSRNYNTDSRSAFAAQLKSGDPHVQIAAAEALYDLHDKSIFPVLTKLLTSDERDIDKRAIILIKRMIGLDFNYADATTNEERAKRAAMAERWWKDNGDKFRFPEADPDPVAAAQAAVAATPADHADEWVANLGSVSSTTADQAETNLRAQGKASVHALIAGLDTNAAIVRRRCNELLKIITKQDFGFDPHGTDAERAKAVASWKSWADANLPAEAGAKKESEEK